MNAAQYRNYAVEQLGTIPEVQNRIGSSTNSLLFNFLNALIIVDQNRMAIGVAVYAVLYLLAAVIMILINGTASKKHSRL